MRKQYTTALLKNKAMNDNTYQIRRNVMDIIYKVKKYVPDMPRMTVRVTENDEHILGVARMNNNIIWISERHSNNFSTVLHEILHAWKGIEHNENCMLMSPYHNPRLTDKKAMELFLTYVQ
tara:strand:+ start:83 stop:445 length:363 start_codon:yes stop_codon:yes gene_type:complete